MNHLKFSTLMFLFLSISNNAYAIEGSMVHLPTIKPKKTYTIDSKETGDTLLEQRGYGDKEPEVRMMNLMMVEGSGFEGMDMGTMKMVDANTPSKEKAKTMGGMDMGSKSSTNSSANENKHLETSGLKLQLKTSPNPSKVGPNVFEFALTDSQGNARKGLKLTSKVYMTSMDMGTDNPRVKEVKPGLYQVKAVFSMSGSWAVEILGSSSVQKLEIDVSK